MPVKECSRVDGRKIKHLRESAELTQQQLSTSAGPSVSNLSQLEHSRKKDPRINTLKALAYALGVPVDTLGLNFLVTNSTLSPAFRRLRLAV
jgi:transcriptional regulator with XRE-family HTH domain